MFGLFSKKPSKEESVAFCEGLIKNATVDAVLDNGNYKAFLVQVAADGASLLAHFKHPEAQSAIVSTVESRIARKQFSDPSGEIGMVQEMRQMTNWKPNMNALRAVVGHGGKPLLSWTPDAANKRDMYDEVASSYINLVKSRVVAAVTAEDELLVRPQPEPDQRLRLLCALAAYFVARTDLELTQRGVAEHKRRIVWMALSDTILEEMDFDGEEFHVTKALILKQAELFGAMLESRGVADIGAVCTTLAVMCRDGELPQDQSGISANALTPGVSALLVQQHVSYGT